MAKDVLNVVVQSKGESSGSLTLNSAKALLKRTQEETPGFADWVRVHTPGFGAQVHADIARYFEEPHEPISFFGGGRRAGRGALVEEMRSMSTRFIHDSISFPVVSAGYGKITDCIIFDDAITDDEDSDDVDWDEPTQTQEGSNTMATMLSSLQSKSDSAAVRNAGGVVGRIIGIQGGGDGQLVYVNVDARPSELQAMLNNEVLVQPTRAHEGTVGVVLDRVMRDHINTLCDAIGLATHPPDGMAFDRIFAKLAEVINTRLSEAQQEDADNKGAARELAALTHKMVAAKILQPNAGKYDATCLAMHWVEQKRAEEAGRVMHGDAVERLQHVRERERDDVASYLRDRAHRDGLATVTRMGVVGWVESLIECIETGDHANVELTPTVRDTPRGYKYKGTPRARFEDDGHVLQNGERVASKGKQPAPASGIVSRPSRGEPAVCYGGGYFREGADGEPEWVPTPNARELRK